MAVRHLSPRGRAVPPPEYHQARTELLAALSALQRLNVPQRVTAAELGISREAVSEWVRQAS